MWNQYGPEMNENMIKDVLFEVRYFFATQLPLPLRSVGLVGYFEAIEPILLSQIKIDILYYETTESQLCEMPRRHLIKIEILKKMKEDYPELYKHLKLTLMGAGGAILYPNAEITKADLEILNYGKPDEEK